MYRYSHDMMILANESGRTVSQGNNYIYIYIGADFFKCYHQESVIYCLLEYPKPSLFQLLKVHHTLAFDSVCDMGSVDLQKWEDEKNLLEWSIAGSDHVLHDS